MPAAVITSKHQLTVPKEVRERLMLGKGDRVRFEAMADGRFVLSKAGTEQRSDGAARRRLKGKVTPLSLDAIKRAARDAAIAGVKRRAGD